jgi:hypothetical protein
MAWLPFSNEGELFQTLEVPYPRGFLIHNGSYAGLCSARRLYSAGGWIFLIVS